MNSTWGWHRSFWSLGDESSAEGSCPLHTKWIIHWGFGDIS